MGLSSFDNSGSALGNLQGSADLDMSIEYQPQEVESLFSKDENTLKVQ